jgi:Rrf2 family protein
MRVSHRGLYALQALLHLAEAHDKGLVTIHRIAAAEEIPAKFLESILVTLKNARLVASERGRDGGYRLRRPPSQILIGDVVRLIDGPLAPFGDAVELADRVRTDRRHAGLFDLFLELRNAVSGILDHTTLQDLLDRDRRLMAAREAASPSRPEPGAGFRAAPSAAKRPRKT